MKYQILKTLLLLYGAIFSTACLGQTNLTDNDSVICLNARQIDYLLTQTVLVKKYKADSFLLEEKIANKEKQLILKDSILSNKDNIIDLSAEQLELKQLQISTAQKQLLESEKKNKRLKFGVWCIALGGAASSVYFMIH